MKGTLRLEDGREVTVEIDENTLKSIEEPKKMGYERVCAGKEYYTAFHGKVVSFHELSVEEGGICSLKDYEDANYYSDESVAKNNARADRLMRKLRRFAVEHRETKLDWKNQQQPKWCIEYVWISRTLSFGKYTIYHGFGQIYFDTQEAVEEAIKEFKDELLWYFTEYKDSL